MYVDPAVDNNSMMHIAETINTELNYMVEFLTPHEEAEKVDDAGDELERRTNED